ncbi:MAG: nicotinate (nicotinamide) nucleotide adenylyltransferase [Rhodothermales bacterium]|nr:nicotinate (nicotinamide) nucleotide adenylyltransferase [Rhodothermales bacterium]
MRVGIFGGSFNPPHSGHLIVAESVRSHCALDKVVWVPNNIPPHKTLAAGSSNQQRREMVSLAIQGNPHFELSDVELGRDGPSYMVDTLELLKRDYLGAEFSLILGMDSLISFAAWRSPETILKLAKLVVYPRVNLDAAGVPVRVLESTEFVRSPLIELSSTAIRECIQEGRSIRYQVPESVLAFIETHGLYQPSV